MMFRSDHFGNPEPRTLAALRDTLSTTLLSDKLRVPAGVHLVEALS